MVHVVAPEVKPGVDALLGEVALEQRGGAHALVLPGALAHAEDDVALGQQLHVGVVGRQVLHEVHRGVVVEGLVHPAAEEVLGVVAARKRDAALEQVGATQRDDGGVGGAHGAAGGERQELGLVLLLDERHELVHHVGVVGLLHGGAGLLVALTVGPALLVHGIDAEQLDLATFHEVGQLVHHAEVLVLVGQAILRGEHDHGVALGAVDKDVHVAAEGVAVLLEFGTLQGNHLPYYLDYRATVCRNGRVRHASIAICTDENVNSM